MAGGFYYWIHLRDACHLMHDGQPATSTTWRGVLLPAQLPPIERAFASSSLGLTAAHCPYCRGVYLSRIGKSSSSLRSPDLF